MMEMQTNKQTAKCVVFFFYNLAIVAHRKYLYGPRRSVCKTSSGVPLADINILKY